MRIVHNRQVDGNLKEQLGPYEIESLLSEADEAAATAYRVRIEPHQRTNTSYHKIAEEFYYVLEGTGVAFLNGVASELCQGDFLRLPPGTTHSFVTADEALVLLDIHFPGSRPNRDVYFVDATPRGFAPPSQPDLNQEVLGESKTTD
jgi:mannose-6-phosphate isomerase-like protein (cupin superfamily)